MVVDATSSVCDLGALDSLNGDALKEIVESWNGFCFATDALVNGKDDRSHGSKFVSQAHALCKHGLESLVQEHFIGYLEETFEKNGASKFWQHFDAYRNVAALGMNMDPAKVHDLAGDDYRSSVLETIKEWIQAVPLQFLHALLAYLGDSISYDTHSSGGNSSGPGNTGDSLLEELNRDEESQENTGVEDDINTDDKQAWINAERWEPDPVEADPLKGSRNQRKVDILGMIVSIIGSKDQLVNEYRVMLAEKLLNKSDYDIDAEIRTLELLKIHFGEISMQRCEIMLNDLIDSKRTNTNIKATINQPSQSGAGNNEFSLDILSSTIISTNFWPPIQDEAFNIPKPVDQLLTDYAKRFNEIKTPRKLLWKKNLGAVKLELEFEDRSLQFTVTPVHASIIMQFQDQASWTSKNLSAAIGLPVDVLNRRISFWISKGILSESSGADSNDHTFTLVEGTVDTSKAGANTGGCEELLVGDDDGERSVASVEDQLHKEMTVYEKFIIGMLTNFGSMALDRIHNTLKMFCVADPRYDKSLQQLQSFLSGLVSEEKLEIRDEMYILKK
ncbi:anaphase-promoting complex/cyclosome 2 [Actinidia rufa]|uniref:Anaphase-promoting complex subunit 2 n=1 Tax=Actinidia rufa TaxID=165716 RepID=A0A7J0EQ99_9ERIC|nr:anaphase-promoting complex/cyclosome 2 [Actinidia rufa]